MREAERGSRRACRLRNIATGLSVLISLMCLSPLTIRAANEAAGGFRGGVCFSQARPLTIKQQATLLKGLRRLTGFCEIHPDTDGFLVLGNRSHFTGGSETARALISAAIGGQDSYVVESHDRSSEVAFARIGAGLDYVNWKSAPRTIRHSWSVAIDFSDYRELRGQKEAIVSFDPALNLLHELAHAVMNLRDSTSESDSLGECERYVNQIRRELGLAERESYAPVKEIAVTPFGTGHRVVGQLTFVRINSGAGPKKFRLTFDVENVFVPSPVKIPLPRVLAARR